MTGITDVGAKDGMGDGEVVKVSDGATVVVGPDDHLMIILSDHATAAQVAQMRDQMRNGWPTIADRVLIIANIQAVAVLRTGGARG